MPVAKPHHPIRRPVPQQLGTSAGAVPAFVRPQRRAIRALASEVGQGTVEYVGLLLLMATVLAAVVAASSQLGGNDQIGKKVVQQVGKSIDKAGKEPAGK